MAFRDFSHAYLFQPVSRRFGIGTASFLVFLVSGILHELVISVPAGGGYGLPTLYFLIQFFGILFYRYSLRHRLKRKFLQHCYAVLIVLGPSPLLLHNPFITNVIHPFINRIGDLL